RHKRGTHKHSGSERNDADAKKLRAVRLKRCKIAKMSSVGAFECENTAAHAACVARLLRRKDPSQGAVCAGESERRADKSVVRLPKCAWSGTLYFACNPQGSVAC